MALVSIIIPIYKVEAYLEKCLDSVLAQTYRDLEIILVDDGSPDRCGEICDRYAEKDKRIRVIHKKNGGLSDARNAGIEIAKGEYITFIDSDDYVAQDHVFSLYKALKDTDSDIAISNIMSVSENGTEIELYCPTRERQVLEQEKVFETLNQPCACAKLYKRRIYDLIRFPVGRLYEDAFIWHDVLALAERIVYTGAFTYFYLTREGSIIHQEYRYEFTDIVDAIEARIRKLEELGLQGLADENRLFIYSRVGAAYAYLDASVPRNRARLDEIKQIYDREYPRLLSGTKNVKQLLRYWLLHRNPALHTKLYGKKMSKVLG